MVAPDPGRFIAQALPRVEFNVVVDDCHLIGHAANGGNLAARRGRVEAFVAGNPIFPDVAVPEPLLITKLWRCWEACNWSVEQILGRLISGDLYIADLFESVRKQVTELLLPLALQSPSMSLEVVRVAVGLGSAGAADARPFCDT